MAPALQTTATLLLRGALFQKLNIGFPKTLVSSKTSPEGIESLCVKCLSKPSEDDLKKVFAHANIFCEDGEEVLVYDLAPLPLNWADSAEFGCEYVKYKAKETETVLRIAIIPKLAFSCLAHKVGEGPEYVSNLSQIPALKLVSFSYNDKKQELMIEYFLAGPAVSAQGERSVVTEISEFPLNQLKPCLLFNQEEEEEDRPASEKGQTVTPWSVESKEGGIQYNKLIAEFGVQEIDPPLLELFTQVTGHVPHPWLRRGIFFSHRDLKEALVAKQQGRPLYLYTGRGPSSESLHFGHLIPFMFTKWLQEVLDCPLVIQLTDDEKYLFQKTDKELEEFTRLGYENAKDIMAVGFNPNKTFIFLNTEYIGHFYPLVVEIQKHVTYNQTKGIFGFSGSTSIGQISFPAIQAAPSFSECFPTVLNHAKRMTCLIPCAIDQDPYFRMTRDVAKKLGLKKPCLVHAKFFPSLQGVNGKMSGSIVSSSVMVTDTPEMIRDKIKGAFSGGRSGDGMQAKLGADLDEDVAFQWLRFFEMDDAELNHVARLYGPGELKEGEVRMMTKEVKERLTKLIVSMAQDHQAKKAALSQEVMNQVFSVRNILS